MSVNVYIDMSDLSADGKIRIRIDNQGNGGWYQYTWGGNTFQEAYDKVH